MAPRKHQPWENRRAPDERLAISRAEVLRRFVVSEKQLDEAVMLGQVSEYRAPGPGRPRPCFCESEIALFWSLKDGEDKAGKRKAPPAAPVAAPEPEPVEQEPLPLPVMPLLSPAAQSPQVQEQITMALLVRELTSMLREVRTEKQELHKALLAPVQTGVELLKGLLDQQSQRVQHLEQGWFDLFTEREELLSRKHERILADKTHEAEQARKTRILDMLKEQIPGIMHAWSKQSDLRAFVGSLPPEIVDLLRDEGSNDVKAKLASIAPKNGKPS